MTLTIAVIPIIGLLVLFIISLLFSSVRSSKLARLKSESEAFVARVTTDDAALQERFVNDLLEGKPLADTIENFERSRAALLPTKIEEAAAWGAEALRQFTQQRLENNAAEVTRKYGTAALLSSMFVIAACLIGVAVLYQFTPGNSDMPGSTPPLPVDPINTNVLPPTANPSSFPTPSQSPPPENVDDAPKPESTNHSAPVPTDDHRVA